MSTHVLTSRFEVQPITAGGSVIRWKGCQSVTIEKSIFTYRDRATIVLPNTAVLSTEGSPVELPSRMTARQFAVGMPITIDLGWDGNTRREFEGFISEIHFGEPCTLVCEGWSWVLRTRRNLTRNWPTVKLRTVMEHVMEGTDITLSDDIPDITLRNLVLHNASGTQVIDYIRGLFNGILTAFFIGREFYIGLTYRDVARETVKYRLGWNTHDADRLRHRRAEDIEVNVEIKFRNDAGQQVVTRTGPQGGVTKTETISAVSNPATLRAIAETRLEQERFDGFEGAIDTLIVPYCAPGYRAEVSDLRYPQRSGTYFVESTTLTYGVNGTNRTVALGLNLDA